jgi:hypothetical protein
MRKYALAVMVMVSGNAEDVAEQVKNIAHYVVVRGIRNGNTLAKYVVEQARFPVSNNSIKKSDKIILWLKFH